MIQPSAILGVSASPLENLIKTIHNGMFSAVSGLHFPAGVKECS